ncbi:MAG TPA: hypothetical protein PLH56_04495 [Candidatus Omnitrophota bacterium]|nr:hypothetical protein [Candidatus Omnitrophota bacterium]
MKKIFFLIVFTFLSILPAVASAEIDNPSEFKLHNPDGNKYEFVKNYLNSLNQLKDNAKRRQSAAAVSYDDFKDPRVVKTAIENLILDNTSLRVARNYILKYRVPENGLILKVVDLFTKSCDEQIAQNTQERELLEKYQGILLGDRMDEKFQGQFFEKMEALVLQRKESHKKMLEASVLAGKVLISAQTDKKGNFVYLGITKNEREKLLLKLDTFYERVYQGELREGQTFFQGSVATIREILEDKNLKTIK